MSSKHTFEQSITKQIFNTLREHVIRSRTTITVVFLGLYNENELHVDEAPNIKENITVFEK